MLVVGFPSTQPSSATQRQVSDLLTQQGLVIPANQLYYDSFVDALEDQPASFGLQKNQAVYLIHLLEVLRSSPASPKALQTLPRSCPFEEALITQATRLPLDVYPSCTVLQNLWTMRHVSELLGLQLKVYTEFNGLLSSRKFGSKSVRRVFLFANPDNQYIVLSKTFSVTDVPSPSSVAAETEATGTGSPKSPYECAGSEDRLDGSRAPLASADWSTGESPAAEVRFTRSYAPSYPTPVPHRPIYVAPWVRAGLSPKTNGFGSYLAPHGQFNSATNATPSNPAMSRSEDHD